MKGILGRGHSLSQHKKQRAVRTIWGLVPSKLRNFRFFLKQPAGARPPVRLGNRASMAKASIPFENPAGTSNRPWEIIAPPNFGEVLLLWNLPEFLCIPVRRAMWTFHKEHLLDCRGSQVPTLLHETALPSLIDLLERCNRADAAVRSENQCDMGRRRGKQPLRFHFIELKLRAVYRYPLLSKSPLWATSLLENTYISAVKSLLVAVKILFGFLSTNRSGGNADLLQKPHGLTRAFREQGWGWGLLFALSHFSF